MWNELGVFKEMEDSEYHWSKGSEGEEAGDEGRETGRASY